MTLYSTRRDFLRRVGLSALGTNLALGLPSLARADGADSARSLRPQRLVFVFSPNGINPQDFWPETLGEEYEIQRILQPLADFKNQMLMLHGICNQISGDGDAHLKGMGGLLTGIELFPGDLQGGVNTPAGWSQGVSVDQYIKNCLQQDPQTQTRFGSLEFGVMIRDRADTWTRMSYSGPNQPVAPIDDPYQMFEKLYGQAKNRQVLASVLDGLAEDCRRLESMISTEDRHVLQDHLAMVRAVEKDLQSEQSVKAEKADVGHAVPQLPPNVDDENDNIPQISRMQVELMVNSFAADFARVATYQITNSVGQPRMTWLGIDEGHHALSHEPDSNEEAYEKLIRINTWYCQQVAHLAMRLSETPEPYGEGTLLDNTTIVWTNELGKGNNHTRNNIPFVLVGGGLGWQMGRALDFEKVPHNRLLMSFCEAMGHPVESFGNPDFCGDGRLAGLTG